MGSRQRVKAAQQQRDADVGGKVNIVVRVGQVLSGGFGHGHLHVHRRQRDIGGDAVFLGHLARKVAHRFAALALVFFGHRARHRRLGPQPLQKRTPLADMLDIDARRAPHQIVEVLGSPHFGDLAPTQEADLALEQGTQQVVAVGEVVVDQRLADAGVAAQALHRNFGEAFLQDQPCREVQDLVGARFGRQAQTPALGRGCRSRHRLFAVGAFDGRLAGGGRRHGQGFAAGHSVVDDLSNYGLGFAIQGTP